MPQIGEMNIGALNQKSYIITNNLKVSYTMPVQSAVILTKRKKPGIDSPGVSEELVLNQKCNGLSAVLAWLETFKNGRRIQKSQLSYPKSETGFIYVHKSPSFQQDLDMDMDMFR